MQRSLEQTNGDAAPGATFPPDTGTDYEDVDVVESPITSASLRRRHGSRALQERAGGGGSGAAIGELGVNVITAIAGNEEDVSWNLKQLEGSYHPLHDTWSHEDRNRYGRDGYRTFSFDVFGKMETVLGDEISAQFPVSFQGNGHYIQNLAIEPPGNVNDAFAWGLSVETLLRRDATVHSRGGKDNVASLEVVFTYHFSSPIHDSSILKLTYRLYATGEIRRDSRWTQTSSY